MKTRLIFKKAWVVYPKSKLLYLKLALIVIIVVAFHEIWKLSKWVEPMVHKTWRNERGDPENREDWMSPLPRESKFRSWDQGAEPLRKIGGQTFSMSRLERLRSEHETGRTVRDNWVRRKVLAVSRPLVLVSHLALLLISWFWLVRPAAGATNSREALGASGWVKVEIVRKPEMVASWSSYIWDKKMLLLEFLIFRNRSHSQ